MDDVRLFKGLLIAAVFYWIFNDFNKINLIIFERKNYNTNNSAVCDESDICIKSDISAETSFETLMM